MSKVRTLVVDDEPAARHGLREMIAELEWMECVGVADNGLEAVDAIARLTPDLVLLDIQMPGLLGTEVVQRIVGAPLVVFTTAHAQHAVTAFELGAVDYLLKPFGRQRFAAAMDRVRAVIGEPSPTPSLERLAETLRAGPVDRLFVRTGRAIVPVPVSDVLWVEALGDYVVAQTASHRHVLHVALQRLESRLDARRFVRIHRTHIVNLDHVAAFRSPSKGQMVAEMRNGARLAVSRSRAPDLRALGY